MKFYVDIEETYTKEIEIEANSPEEALRSVEEAYRDDRILLTDEDFFDYKVQILP